MRRPLFAILLCACASAPSPQPQQATAPPAAPVTPPPVPPAQPKPVPERMAADTPRSTPSGVTFTAPAGWSVLSQDSAVILEPPEPDSHLAIVGVQAKDADEAAAAAWKLYKPEMNRPIRVATDRPAREGWEEKRVYEYETSPNERAEVYAIVHRAGEAWTVLLIDFTEPTFERRAAPRGLITQSLRPKGYQRESFAGRKPHALDAERIAQMKSLVELGMRELGVPGVGFSLIDGGKVVFEGGLGVRELGKPAKVDKDTVFIAASNTKAMTTLLLARLVDQKKLDWDEPVTLAYPAFKLGDAETSSQVLIKHLICACTGLPRQDLEWIFEFAQATPTSSMTLLGTMQPTTKFGEVFQYSNLMAAAAGYIGGNVLYPARELGAAYDEAMAANVFRPLGMRSTTFDFVRAQKGNCARPHGPDVDGKMARGKMDLNYAVIPVRPAGGVWTSAHDLSQYVLMELRGGKLPDGTQLVSEENLRARQAPQVLLGEDQSYGMGLIEDRTWGVTVVHHGGDLAGYHSDMMWLPEHGIGAVILTNADEGWRLRRPFLRRLLEVVFDGRPEAEGDLTASVRAWKESVAKERKRLTVPADLAEAAKLAARYRNAALGDVAVLRGPGAVLFDVGEWKSEVASRKNDDGTVSFVTIDPTLAGFEFVMAQRDGKRALITRDGQHEYFFEEVQGQAAAVR
jgi:CubicO group peptidase (beta-lactamase class C family)